MQKADLPEQALDVVEVRARTASIDNLIASAVDLTGDTGMKERLKPSIGILVNEIDDYDARALEVKMTRQEHAFKIQLTYEMIASLCHHRGIVDDPAMEGIAPDKLQVAIDYYMSEALNAYLEADEHFVKAPAVIKEDGPNLPPSYYKSYEKLCTMARRIWMCRKRLGDL